MNRSHCRDYRNKPVSNGNFFKSDKCKICLCSNGSKVFCTAELCTPPANCNDFVMKADDCCNFGCVVGPTTHMKVTSLEGETNKQGARFGATSLTVFIIITLFSFMLLRLKRRQALLSSLIQRPSLSTQTELLYPGVGRVSDVDAIEPAQLRRMFMRQESMRPRALLGWGGGSEFIRIVPSSPVGLVPTQQEEAPETPVDVYDFTTAGNPVPNPPLDPPSPDVTSPPLYEKEDLPPPPYPAPPTYEESCDQNQTTEDPEGGEDFPGSCPDPPPLLSGQMDGGAPLTSPTPKEDGPLD